MEILIQILLITVQEYSRILDF